MTYRRGLDSVTRGWPKGSQGPWLETVSARFYGESGGYVSCRNSPRWRRHFFITREPAGRSCSKSVKWARAGQQTYWARTRRRSATLVLQFLSFTIYNSVSTFFYATRMWGSLFYFFSNTSVSYPYQILRYAAVDFYKQLPVLFMYFVFPTQTKFQNIPTQNFP